MRKRAFVIKEIGADDPTPWAVVHHRNDRVPDKWVLVVHAWYKTEDEARAAAHRYNHPE